MDLDKRRQMAAESILENESLREGLDDDAGNALLDWGITRAKQIAGETAAIEDDEAANEFAYPRMRALRRILRDVVSLCTEEEIDPARQAELLQEIADQVPIVYGPLAPHPETDSWISFMSAPAENNAQKIIGFRTLLEENASIQ